MLKLCGIIKDYKVADSYVRALNDINLEFRKSEFVSILGQSGCGKTTLLNIVGGLDRYTSGDLFIDGVSTKDYKDVDWDIYRNIRIGFIFQSYNLISHMTILDNVAMALTLAGVNLAERKRRALEVLDKVGLKEQASKLPGQLSGGQMQRVSIARALINNPDIILADEPTGALDSATSVQIMELLKEISDSRLIIMVTHNAELAKQYSTRIVKLSDGEVVDDSNPYDFARENQDAGIDEITTDVVGEPIADEAAQSDAAEQPSEDGNGSDKKTTIAFSQSRKEKKKALNKTSMSFFTAVKLSFNNLMTKKGRTIMTAVAGSIGIIGVALVLAISNGFNGYIKDIESGALSGYPIEINESSIDYNALMSLMSTGQQITDKKDNVIDGVIKPTSSGFDLATIGKIKQTNKMSDEMIAYVSDLQKQGKAAVQEFYGINMKVLGRVKLKNKVQYSIVNQKSNEMSLTGGDSPNINWQSLVGGKDFVLKQYDVLDGRYPEGANEVVLIIDSNNEVPAAVYKGLGLNIESASSVKFEDALGLELRIAPNDIYYGTQSNAEGVFEANDDFDAMYASSETVPVKIVGILRQKENLMMAMQSAGVAYNASLAELLLSKEKDSAVVAAQAASDDVNVITGQTFEEINSENTSIFAIKIDKKSVLKELGGDATPSTLAIYPYDFDAKEYVLNYIDSWNNVDGRKGEDKISYTDMSAMATSMMEQVVNVISIVLVCFAAISLVVSSVMIGIITYVSVVERTKEIGILRSLGARKKDITRVFNAETLLIGFTAGVIGVVLTYILSIPINLILKAKIEIGTLCALSPIAAVILIAVSMLLTFIAGLIPARIASKKDPVVALRTE